MSVKFIEVAVRIRPLDENEKESAKNITSVSPDGTVLYLQCPKKVTSGEAAKINHDQRTVLKSYSFDSVLPPSASQTEAYDITAKPLVSKVLSGYNATMFCYGQTDSGKSHTIFGNSLPSSPGDRDGILFSAIRDLYAHDYFESKSEPSNSSRSSNAASRTAPPSYLFLSASERVTSVTRTVSFYEIYNERIFDLLDECGGFIPDPAPPSSSSLPARGDNAQGLLLRENPITGPFIQDLSHHDVSDVADDDDDATGPAATAAAVVTKKNDAPKGAKAALPSFGSGLKKLQRLINYGITKRATSSTNMNNRSSRSHAVFILDVAVTATTGQQANGATSDHEDGQKSTATGTSNTTLSRQIHSCLTIVDLAGSERQSQTSSAGQRLKEANGINKSLLILGQVINALACNGESGSNDGRHVSYRSSKLTQLLQPSLGGNSFTAIIGTISPLSSNLNDTMSTMKFCERAKLIKNCATVNEKTVGGGVEELKNEISRLRKELAQERARVAVLEEVDSSRNYRVLPSLPTPPAALSSTPNPPTHTCNTPISSSISVNDNQVVGGVEELKNEISRLRKELAEVRASAERNTEDLMNKLEIAKKEKEALVLRADAAERRQKELESRVAQLELEAASSNARHMHEERTNSSEVKVLKSVGMNLNLSRDGSENGPITLNHLKKMEAEVVEKLKNDEPVEVAGQAPPPLEEQTAQTPDAACRKRDGAEAVNTVGKKAEQKDQPVKDEDDADGDSESGEDEQQKYCDRSDGEFPSSDGDKDEDEEGDEEDEDEDNKVGGNDDDDDDDDDAIAAIPGLSLVREKSEQVLNGAWSKGGVELKKCRNQNLAVGSRNRQQNLASSSSVLHACNQRGCSYKAKRASHLKSHLAHIHDIGVVWHECNQPGCNFKAKHAGNLKAHLTEIHLIGVVWHECNQRGCSYKVKRASDLKIHLANIHDIGVVWHECKLPGCNVKAKKACNLKKHLVRDHGTGIE